MKSGEMTSLIKLFDKQNIQYFVGVMQRYFDWRMDNLEKYFDCLMEYTDVEKKTEHLMHATVMKPLVNDRLLDYISITDGQQRITTTYLHICAICAFVKNNDISKEEFDYEAIREDFLINPRKKGDNKYKLLLRNKDMDTLKEIVDELPAPLSEKAGSPKIIRAYNYLYNQLDIDNYQDIFFKMFYMVVVQIIADPEDDENIIFETLNTGGRAVSLFDQIRAYTLAKYNLKQQEILNKKYWEDIEQYSHPNSVIRNFVIFISDGTGNSRVYSHFKRLVSLKYKNDMENVLSDISYFYKVYSKVTQCNTSDEDIDFLLEGLNLTYHQNHISGIVKIYSFYLNGEIDRDTLLNSFKLLLSVGLREKIKSKSSNSFRSLFEYNVNWIKSDNLYNILYKTLKPLFISDSQFEMLICDRNFYRGDKEEFDEENKHIPSNINKITKYLLLSIENSHHGKGRINPKHYDIEHICPKKLDGDWEYLFSTDAHHENLHRLGNLTFLAKEYNRSIGNDSFEDKKNNPNGFKDDKLHLNKSIIGYHSWTVDSIQQRTELMAKELCEIFNIPANNLPVTEKANQSILVGGK